MTVYTTSVIKLNTSVNIAHIYLLSINNNTEHMPSSTAPDTIGFPDLSDATSENALEEVGSRII